MRRSGRMPPSSRLPNAGHISPPAPSLDPMRRAGECGYLPLGNFHCNR